MLYYSVDIKKSIADKAGTGGQLVRKVRENLNLSQGELAKLLGVHWVTVSRWESGRGEPRAKCLQGLAQLYLTEAFRRVRELLKGRGAPVSDPASHVLAYDLPEVRPAVGRYVAESLKAGYYVCLVTPSEDAEEELLTRWGLSADKLLSHDGFKLLHTKDVFFRDGHYDLSQMNYLGRKLEEKLVREGWEHIRWLDDVSGLLSSGVSWEELIIMEYNADSVFQSQEISEGLSLYPYPSQLRHSGQACILCRHPRLLGPGGILVNPHYNDPVLCWARSQLKWRSDERA